MNLYNEDLLELFVFGGRGQYRFEDQYERVHAGTQESSTPSPYYGSDWPEIREEILERDGYACRVCGFTEEESKEKYGRSLPVHHIEPARSFDSLELAHDSKNLITVCAPCHNEVEGLTHEQLTERVA